MAKHAFTQEAFGCGSRADALRYEVETGELLSPSGHMTKALDSINRLEKILREEALRKCARVDRIDPCRSERRCGYGSLPRGAGGVVAGAP